MDLFPHIKKILTGDILMRDSAKAKKLANKYQGPHKAKEPAEVVRSAERLAAQMGLVNPSLFELRSLYEIQFGKYRGQTFQWLVENAIGYASYIVATMQREGGGTPDTPLGHNKEQLKIYMESFPDGRKAIRQKLAETGKRPQYQASVPSTSRPVVTKGPVIPAATITSAQLESEMETDIPDEELMRLAEDIEASQGQVTPHDQLPRLQPEKPPKMLGLVRPQEDYPLPEGWKQSLPKPDHQWVSKAFFRYNAKGKAEFKPGQLNGLWHYPPSPAPIPTMVPKPDRYFAQPLMLWMPRRMWQVRLLCPVEGCKKELTSAGVYKVVRQVLDFRGYYNLATEYLECGKCNKKYAAWSGAILKQLDPGHRGSFSALLTYRYACDVGVAKFMSQRSLGNSALQFERNLRELHSSAWIKKHNLYSTDCKAYVDANATRLVNLPAFADAPAMPDVPKAKWLLSVTCLDVMDRIDEVRAAITSTFGRVLKIDSTKKVAKKLAGSASGTAAWATNIGNEHGQVLMSVLTCAEGFGLEPMLQGVIKRYSDAGVSPPEIIYVDRDCCGSSSIRRMTSEWPNTQVRLDIWHFMRRFSSGCTTDSHPLYGLFMRRLSQCIFEWGKEDLQRLREAKRSELALKNTCGQSDIQDIQLTKGELARHCRRRTRGTEEMTRLLSDLIEAFSGEQGTDLLGVPLFDKERMAFIWESQKKHVACIQDPDGFQLYTETGTQKKGTIRLPVYRCARGSTSLESFHLHLARFIPGTVTSDVHFQMYLLDGLVKWNEDRARQASGANYSTYSFCDRYVANELSQQVFKRPCLPDFRISRKYTGEKIGVEYLYSQTGQTLQEFPLDPDDDMSAQFEPEDGSEEEEDLHEDFGGDTMDDITIPPVETDDPLPAPRAARKSQPHRVSTETEVPSSDETIPSIGDKQHVPVVRQAQTSSTFKGDKQPENLASQQETASSLPKGDEQSQEPAAQRHVCQDNIGGLKEVEDLATYLFNLRDQPVMALSDAQADRLICLWNNLSPHDQTSKITPRHQTQLKKGRFKARRPTSQTIVPGVDSTRRCFLGQGSGPACKPDANRYMERLFLRLCTVYKAAVMERGKRLQRWSLVTRAYNWIRETVYSNYRVKTEARIQLLPVNNATLTKWYNDHIKGLEHDVLGFRFALPPPRLEAAEPLPDACVPTPAGDIPHVPEDQQHQFTLPPNTAGQAGRRKPRKVPIPPLSQQSTAPTTQDIKPLQDDPYISPDMYQDLRPKAKSTAWYQRKQRKRQEAGELVRRYKPRTSVSKCSKCGKLRTAEQHTQYYGSWYCAATATETMEQWRSSREKCRHDKKNKKEKKDN